MLTGGTELPTSSSVYVFITLGQLIHSFFYFSFLLLVVLVCNCAVEFLLLDVWGRRVFFLFFLLFRLSNFNVCDLRN